jgi:hypothetical protein
MKKLVLNALLVLVLLFSGAWISTGNANSDKPPRPEKMEEVQTERPSEYHTWSNGRWNWNKKVGEWIWKEGYWRFDHDLYAFKNRWRYGNYYRPWRYLAVPIGRGYYRIVRY